MKVSTVLSSSGYSGTFRETSLPFSHAVHVVPRHNAASRPAQVAFTADMTAENVPMR